MIVTTVYFPALYTLDPPSAIASADLRTYNQCVCPVRILLQRNFCSREEPLICVFYVDWDDLVLVITYSGSSQTLLSWEIAPSSPCSTYEYVARASILDSSDQKLPRPHRCSTCQECVDLHPSYLTVLVDWSPIAGVLLSTVSIHPHFGAVQNVRPFEQWRIWR